MNITKFGAFVNILPGRDGLLHISKLGRGKRIDRVEDVLNLGDEVDGAVDDIDQNGKLSLSLVGDEPEGGGDGGGDGGEPREPRRPGRPRRVAVSDGDGGGEQRPGAASRRASFEAFWDDAGQGGVRRPRSGRRAAARAPWRRARGGGGGGRAAAVRPAAASRGRADDGRRRDRPHPARLRAPRRHRVAARASARSTLGFWVGTGSRDETDEQSGASHFLEHLLFKGTEPTGPRREIAEAVESVGGDMNAFTDAGAHRVLRARPRPAPRARARHPLRHRVAAGVPAERRRVGAAGDPRRDRDARRHARRSRARPVRAGAVSRAPARSRGARERQQHQGDDARRDRGVPRRALPPVERGGRGRRQPRPRRRARAAPSCGSPPDTRCSSRARPADAARDAEAARRREPADASRRTSCSACARCPRSTPTATRSRCRTRCSAAGCPRGCSRRCGRSAASRTPCSRTAPRTRTPASSAVYAGTAPERVQETLDVIGDGARPAGRRRRLTTASSTRPRATSRVRSRCRSRARRAACAASAAPSWSRARSRLDELVARVDAVTADDVEPRDRPRAARRAAHARRRRDRTNPATSRRSTPPEARGGTLRP